LSNFGRGEKKKAQVPPGPEGAPMEYPCHHPKKEGRRPHLPLSTKKKGGNAGKKKNDSVPAALREKKRGKKSIKAGIVVERKKKGTARLGNDAKEGRRRKKKRFLARMLLDILRGMRGTLPPIFLRPMTPKKKEGGKKKKKGGGPFHFRAWPQSPSITT